MKITHRLGQVVAVIVGSELIFKLIDNPIYKIMFGWFCLTVMLPIIIFYLQTALKQEKINQIKENSQEQRKKSNKVTNGISDEDLAKLITQSNKQFKPKIIENNLDYQLVKDCFHDMIQNQQLNNSQIVTYLDVINKRLGNHLYNYNGFRYQNHAHEIYIKLKSSKFKKDDFRILYNELIRINYGLVEPEKDYYLEAINIENTNNTTTELTS